MGLRGKETLKLNYFLNIYSLTRTQFAF